MTTTFDQLSPRDAALLDEVGAGKYTRVSANLVESLNGNGNAAIFLSQLLWWARRKADDDGWFYRTRKQMKERCGLSSQAQQTAEKVLQSLNLIEKERRGMPARNHYRLHLNSIVSRLAGDPQESGGSPPIKNRGVGAQSSSGGYMGDQVPGGSPPNSIEKKEEKEHKDHTERTHAHAQGEEDQEEEKDPDPVDLYHEIMPRRANNVQKDMIKTLVDDLDAWREVLRTWRGNGWNPKSVKKMIDRYEREAAENREEESSDGEKGEQRKRGAPSAEHEDLFVTGDDLDD